MWSNLMWNIKGKIWTHTVQPSFQEIQGLWEGLICISLYPIQVLNQLRKKIFVQAKVLPLFFIKQKFKNDSYMSVDNGLSNTKPQMHNYLCNHRQYRNKLVFPQGRNSGKGEQIDQVLAIVSSKKREIYPSSFSNLIMFLLPLRRNERVKTRYLTLPFTWHRERTIPSHCSYVPGIVIAPKYSREYIKYRIPDHIFFFTISEFYFVS